MEREPLGAFALANLLTLRFGVPARTAQILVGAWITAHEAAGSRRDAATLVERCREAGHEVLLRQETVAETLDIDSCLRLKQTAGSTAPDSVHRLLGMVAERSAVNRQRLLDRTSGLQHARVAAFDLLGEHR